MILYVEITPSREGLCVMHLNHDHLSCCSNCMCTRQIPLHW